MLIEEITENVAELVEKLNFAEKVQRSLDLIDRAYQEYGNGLVVANSLGKDSSVIWHLAKQVRTKIPGFIVTTRFKPDGKEYGEITRYKVADLCASGNLREPHLRKGSEYIDYVDYTCFRTSCSIRCLGRVFMGHDKTAWKQIQG